MTAFLPIASVFLLLMVPLVNLFDQAEAADFPSYPTMTLSRKVLQCQVSVVQVSALFASCVLYSCFDEPIGKDYREWIPSKKKTGKQIIGIEGKG